MKTPRRWMAWLLGLGMVVTLFPGSTYAAASSITLEVNGLAVRTDVPPAMKDGRVMVPLRWVAEALEAKVHWDREKRAVLIDTDAGLVPATQGRAIGLWVDGRKLEPDVAPLLSKGRTLVSVRVIAEAVGAKVEWNAKERTVKISRPQAALILRRRRGRIGLRADRRTRQRRRSLSGDGRRGRDRLDGTEAAVPCGSDRDRPGRARHARRDRPAAWRSFARGGAVLIVRPRSDVDVGRVGRRRRRTCRC